MIDSWGMIVEEKITAYHGSPQKFAAFKDSNQGKNYGNGLYFTKNKKEATWYAGKSDKNGYIYTVEVTANKIFNVRNEKQAKELSDHLELNWPKVKKEQSWKDPGSGYTSRDRDNFYIKIAGQVYEKYKDYPDQYIRPAILELGYDSIQDDEEEWIVVFSKNQAKIKSIEKMKDQDRVHLKDFDPEAYYGESKIVTEASEEVDESLEEDFKDWNTDRWVHYSKEPFVKINPQQFHQDPAGIYLFPEKFDTEGNWEQFPYKFIVQVPNTLSILDMAQVTVEVAKSFISDLPSKWKERESEIEQDPRSFWGILRDFYGKQKAGEWNKLIRRHGYDAVFDDTGQIHSAEVQFIVLNPTQIKVVEMIDQRQEKGSGFAELGKVMGWFEKLLSQYGEVTVESPKKKLGAWDRTKLPRGSIKVKAGDAYATWDFVVAFVPGEKNALEGINARLGYSNRDMGQKDRSIAWTIPLDAEVLPGRVEQELKNSLGKLSVQTESIIKVPDKYDGPDVMVFKNPTASQIKNLFLKSTDQTLKWIIDKEYNLYVWDAYFYHHREMDEKLNLQSKWSGVVEKESEAAQILNLQKDSIKKPGDSKSLFGEEYWGTAGAGAIIQAQDTGRYLINHRGEETMEPGTWGTWGGKIDEGENAQEALKREIREETGYTGEMAVKYLYTYKDRDFKFYNYLVTVPSEFEPELSWESQDSMWTTLDKLPKPLHFGLKNLLPYLERLHINKKEDLEEKKLTVKAKFEIEKTDDGFEIVAYVGKEIAGNITVAQEYIDSGGECYPFQPYEEEPFYKDICDHEVVTQIAILGVEDEYTEKGIATELMKRAMKEIKKRYGSDPVYINASPMGDVVGLNDLVSFYKTYGFKVLKTYPEHRNALLWKDKP